MATQQEQEGAVPDFLRMEKAEAPEKPTSPNAGDRWYGWPSKELKPITLLEESGRVQRVRTPVMDLEGLITPVELHYVVQHFDVWFQQPAPAGQGSHASALEPVRQLLPCFAAIGGLVRRPSGGSTCGSGRHR